MHSKKCARNEFMLSKFENACISMISCNEANNAPWDRDQ